MYKTVIRGLEQILDVVAVKPITQASKLFRHMLFGAEPTLAEVQAHYRNELEYLLLDLRIKLPPHKLRNELRCLKGYLFADEEFGPNSAKYNVGRNVCSEQRSLSEYRKTQHLADVAELIHEAKVTLDKFAKQHNIRSTALRTQLGELLLEYITSSLHPIKRIEFGSAEESELGRSPIQLSDTINNSLSELKEILTEENHQHLMQKILPHHLDPAFNANTWCLNRKDYDFFEMIEEDPRVKEYEGEEIAFQQYGILMKALEDVRQVSESSGNNSALEHLFCNHENEILPQGFYRVSLVSAECDLPWGWHTDMARRMDCNKVNLPKEKDWKNIISEVDPMTAMAGVAVAGVAFFAMRKMASKASSLSSASHNVTAVDRPLMTESARL